MLPEHLMNHLHLFLFAERATTMTPMIPSAANAIISDNGDLWVTVGMGV